MTGRCCWCPSTLPIFPACSASPSLHRLVETVSAIRQHLHFPRLTLTAATEGCLVLHVIQLFHFVCRHIRFRPHPCHYGWMCVAEIHPFSYSPFNHVLCLLLVTVETFHLSSVIPLFPPSCQSSSPAITRQEKYHNHLSIFSICHSLLLFSFL